MTAIAVIGLGNMGHHMSVNLTKAGHDVHGYDIVPELCEKAAAKGVGIAESASVAAAGADVVITMLQSGEQVQGLYGGPDGIIAAATPGTAFLDCSTISVDDARAAHRLAQDAGFLSVDAPVSGGVVGAEAGTLTFMVGGTSEAFEVARPYFEVMGKRVVHCGDPGAGQAAKICNNLMLAISMIGVSEGFVLGEKLGLTHQALFDVAANASGQCWALTTNCPVPGPVPSSPANRDYQAGFASQLMLKDLLLSQAAAGSSGVDTELGAHATKIYERLVGTHDPHKDFSDIINDVRERSQEG
ncbi:3-hydroxyisobutyrate dehydrogenase [Solicola gregarius]|uniref:3-hydroxyisobutyrate dehydrogenase n=1 Tax=Solicola gregarius TaxID=2908642 RepID=A0AA46YLW3_9ACTN|nr:3-hydroxyisobutyrate dehydrogenase [Solicola gregarius]UYM06014.1 3-hydroxyisobutyrate dehydrogenase [Solicola gregarius]